MVGWYNQSPKNPHSAAHYGVYAFKPRLAPAFLDPAVEPYTGVAVWIEAHKQNDMLFRPAQDATLAQRFGDLTVALVFQVMLPLVIVSGMASSLGMGEANGKFKPLFSPDCIAGPVKRSNRTHQSRGMKSTWGPGSMMNTASVAKTQATAATAIAMWNPENS